MMSANIWQFVIDEAVEIKLNYTFVDQSDISSKFSLSYVDYLHS